MQIPIQANPLAVGVLIALIAQACAPQDKKPEPDEDTDPNNVSGKDKCFSPVQAGETTIFSEVGAGNNIARGENAQQLEQITQFTIHNTNTLIAKTLQKLLEEKARTKNDDDKFSYRFTHVLIDASEQAKICSLDGELEISPNDDSGELSFTVDAKCSDYSQADALSTFTGNFRFQNNTQFSSGFALIYKHWHANHALQIQGKKGLSCSSLQVDYSLSGEAGAAIALNLSGTNALQNSSSFPLQALQGFALIKDTQTEEECALDTSEANQGKLALDCQELE